MILYYIIIAVLLACLYLHLHKQSVKLFFFNNFHAWFFEHKTFAQWYGVRFEKSDTWRTNRRETHMTGFDYPIFKIIGIKIEVGKTELDKIKELKHTITSKSETHQIDFAPYFKKGESYNWDGEFEGKIADIFYEEFFRVFDVPAPKSKAQFIEGILVLRRALSVGGFKGKFIMLKGLGSLWPLAQYFKSLSYAEQMLMIAPFITVLDYVLVNMREKAAELTFSQRLKKLNDYFPIKYLPVMNKGEMVLVEIIVNESNNVSNTMFGPRGHACPGGVLVNMMTDAFTRFMKTVDYKVKRTVKNGKEEVVLSF